MRPSAVVSILREYGLGWAAWRGWYDIQARTGGFQRSFPQRESVLPLLAAAANCDERSISNKIMENWTHQRRRFLLDDSTHSISTFIGDHERVLQDAEGILTGRLRYFSRWMREVGVPPDWFLGAANGARWPSDLHWSRLTDLSPIQGDIKHVWEPSRFGHVYTLVRAHAIGDDDRYPEAFWSHVDDWCGANPPESGPHWRCAQEMGLRCMAWIFGIHAFADHSATTPERIIRLISAIWYHAVHIERIHWYAYRCVRNNHALSEASALYTIGSVFPFLPGSERWRAKGLRSFAREAAWQIYDDGAYIQHSMNYARLVAQLLTWTVSLAHLDDVPGSRDDEAAVGAIRERAVRLLSFLTSMQDSVTGRVPNYGSNDGALLFPLSSCDYLDYRPSLGALNAALGRSPIYPPGPWDEEAQWLVAGGVVQNLGSESAPSRTADSFQISDLHRRRRSFPEGGYYTFEGRQTHAMVRCGAYRHRPAQADMLHLDVWFAGQNVLVDPGNYSYDLQPPWTGYFVGTASHNTVAVDGLDQMMRASRFMWLDWTQGRLNRFETGHGWTIFDGEHDGYSPTVHRRRVVLTDDVYIVVDTLGGDVEDHTFRLHWLVNDFPVDPDNGGGMITVPVLKDSLKESANKLQEASPLCLRLHIFCSGPSERSWMRAEETIPRGWQSIYYGEVIPAWSYLMETKGREIQFTTLLGPNASVEPFLSFSAGSITGGIEAWIDDGPNPSRRLIDYVN